MTAEQRYESVYIDIPDKNTLGEDDNAWVNVHNCHTKSEAVAWIREHIGRCDDEGNINLITLGEEEHEEADEDAPLAVQQG